MHSGHSYARESAVEDLEERRMLSAVTLEDGILIVHGDAGKANAISVTMSKGKVQAAAGRAKLAAAVAKVLAIKIVGGNKADIIDVSPLVKLGAYIDAGAGNDTIRTGGGNDTVVGGAGNDTVANRGGKDQIFGGAGTNTVQATKKDTVYAGTGKSKVTGGAVNRSATEKNPVIPPPPDAPKPVVTDDDGGTEDGSEQPPVVQPVEQDPQEPVVQLPDPGEQPPPPTDTNPPGTQEPGGLDPGGQPQEPTVLLPEDPPPVEVTYGPTLNARDFGAKLNGVTDDRAAIQAALDALPATGGTLVIDGVAAVAGGLTVQGKDHITIKGAAAGNGFVSLPGPDKSTWNFWTVVLKLTDCTNGTVKGLTFEGAGNIAGAVGLRNCQDTMVTGNTVSHTAGGGGAIVATGGLRNTFSYNRITDTYDACRGVWIGNVHVGEIETSPLIEHNTILRCSATGIGGHHAGAVVRNNEVRNCLGAGIALGGYNKNSGYDAVTKDCLVENNVFTGNLFHGVQSDVTGGSPFTLRVTVRGNLCEGNGNAGIYAIHASGWVIEGNVCRNNGYTGIELGWTIDTVIRGNTCESTHAPGAKTQSYGISAFTNGTLPGTLEDTTAGNKQTLKNVVIDGNICTGNSLWGIIVSSLSGGTAAGIQLTGNTCSGNAWDGICVAEQVKDQLTNVAVSGNTCFGNGRINLNLNLL